jgi:hypothetical protein
MTATSQPNRDATSNFKIRQISANPQPNLQEKASNFTITRIPYEEGESPAIAPNGATVLYLEPESTMRKKSHVCDSHVYAIPVSQLTNFGKPLHNRLTKQSYKALVSKFTSIPPQKWIKTQKLVAGKKDPAILSSSVLAPVLAPAQVPVPSPAAPSPAALPAELLKTIDALLQYLTIQQIDEEVPEMLEVYPQLLNLLA